MLSSINYFLKIILLQIFIMCCYSKNGVFGAGFVRKHNLYFPLLYVPFRSLAIHNKGCHLCYNQSGSIPYFLMVF